MDDGAGTDAGAADGALWEAELELVRATLAGEVADLKRKPVRAGVLRDLILETRPGWRLPPVGVRIERAIIQGCLDLDGCTLARPLLVWHSRFEGGGDKGAIVVRDGRLKRLGIHSCTVHGNIVADRVEIENGLFLGGGKVTGALFVRGGTIGGALALDGTELGDGKGAILAAGVRVSGPLIVRRARLAGELAVPRAHLGQGIYAEDLTLTFGGFALNAESARLGGDMLIDRATITGGIRLQNARIAGRLAGDSLTVAHTPEALDGRGADISNGVCLDRARIRGSVILDGAEIGKAFSAEAIEIDGGETAIGADVIEVGGNWEMPRARLVGQLRLPGAQVEGQLRLTEVRVYGTDIAIRGDGAHIRGGCFMSRATIIGLVRFPAADIGNQLRLRGATIKVESGAALLAPGSRLRRDVELGRGFRAIGAVVLDQARIGGVLDLAGSHLTSAAIARGGLPVPSHQEEAQAHGDEHALSLVDATVDRLVMPARAEERPHGIVDLSRARVGSYEDYAAAWPPPGRARARSVDGRDIDHLVLDGFVYEHLGNPSGAPQDQGTGHAHRSDRVALKRIHWLEGQHERDVRHHFKPQAWVALGDRLQRQGYTEDARMILIARLRRERRSHGTTAAARWQGRLLDWLALYGHNPWRTVIWMAAVVVLFAGIWAGAAGLCEDTDCFDQSVFVVSNKDAYFEDRFKQAYPGFHSLAYSFDLFVPFVNFGYDDHWRPNLGYGPLMELPLPRWGEPAGGVAAKGPTLSITIGGLLYVLGVIEAVLGIVLTSLMVTGFTGLLKGGNE